MGRDCDQRTGGPQPRTAGGAERLDVTSSRQALGALVFCLLAVRSPARNAATSTVRLHRLHRLVSEQTFPHSCPLHSPPFTHLSARSSCSTCSRHSLVPLSSPRNLWVHQDLRHIPDTTPPYAAQQPSPSDGSDTCPGARPTEEYCGFSTNCSAPSWCAPASIYTKALGTPATATNTRSLRRGREARMEGEAGGGGAWNCGEWVDCSARGQRRREDTVRTGQDRALCRPRSRVRGRRCSSCKVITLITHRRRSDTRTYRIRTVPIPVPCSAVFAGERGAAC